MLRNGGVSQCDRVIYHEAAIFDWLMQDLSDWWNIIAGLTEHLIGWFYYSIYDNQFYWFIYWLNI